MDTCFTADGKSYEVAYSIGRIDMYESANRPMMAVITSHGGVLSLADLKALVGFGIRESGGEWVNPEEGAAMAGRLVEANGYRAVYDIAVAALRRDCGFFFMAASAGRCAI